jgi:hypothetical protein
MNPELTIDQVIQAYMQNALEVKDDTILNLEKKSQAMLQMAQALNYLVPLATNNQAAELQMKAQEHQMTLSVKQQELEMKQQEHQMKLQQSQDNHQQKLQQASDNHQNSLVQSQQAHESRLVQQQQTQKANDSSTSTQK